MNCRQFNKISVEEILQSLGHFPTKQNEKEAWFLNPFSKEKNASFKINKNLNYWYLFSEGIGGNNIDLMKKYLNASISEVLNWAENQNFSSFHQQTNNQKIFNLSKTYEILEVKEIQHPALMQYLKSRKVETQKPLVSEIHYQMNDKKYFGIGFKNDSDGYEIRNAYSKICLGKKDITTIKNNSKSLLIFEGFFDFLSLKNIEKSLGNETSDYIILNSVSIIHKVKNSLENYEKIDLYFDNDEAGNRAVEIIKSEKNKAEDGRVLYSNFKDLNEWLIHNNLQKDNLKSLNRRRY